MEDNYKNKIENYQSDCKVLLGKNNNFSDYIKQFANNVNGHGLDLGIGPKGCNSRYFSHCVLDGCDVSKDVLNSVSEKQYNKLFQYNLACESLPYKNGELDFIFCSCVIQHLNSWEELENGIREISTKVKNMFYLMFKAGVNNTILSHYNEYYGERRDFRVFHPDNVSQLCQKYGLIEKDRELFVDDNWIPYVCMIFYKK